MGSYHLKWGVWKDPVEDENFESSDSHGLTTPVEVDHCGLSRGHSWESRRSVELQVGLSDSLAYRCSGN